MEIMEVPIDVPTQQKVLFSEETLGYKIGTKQSDYEKPNSLRVTATNLKYAVFLLLLLVYNF